MKLLFILYCGWIFLGTLLYSVDYYDDPDCALQYYGPISKYLYHKTNMNIIGCIICALCYYIGFPLLFIPGKLGMFVFFLFHIGRK